MKQFHLLALFVSVLVLSPLVNSTYLKKSKLKTNSINDILNEIYDSEDTLNHWEDAENNYDLADEEDNNEEVLEEKEEEDEEEDHKDNFESETESESESESEADRLIGKPSKLPKLSKKVPKGWFTIKSQTFANLKKFPQLNTKDGVHGVKYNYDYERINPQFGLKKGIPSKLHFYFRLTQGFIYYTFNKKDMTIAGSINVKNISDLRWSNIGEKKPCLQVIEKKGETWDICGLDVKNVKAWFCKLMKLTKLGEEGKCNPEQFKAVDNNKVVVKTVTQPLIIIPLPSRQCNSSWDYQKKGDDWECMCREGKEQSPINLPPPGKSVDTDVKPLFEYEFVENIVHENFPAGNLKKGEKNVIRLDSNALRIKHPHLGKIVTLDGAVYIAQEIVFHTPSEHQVDGVSYDMEMQVIHHGKSVGDTTKKAVLSVFFKAKPGVFNKFLDKINPFDLPNPLDSYKELHESLFIPHVFLNHDEDDLSVMIPFSFYTYQGSLTTPPCTEQTIHYIASQPIDLSNTVLELFKEALRMPDRKDSSGNVVIANTTTDNNRVVQPLNGRAVFHYDHTKYNCPDYRKKSKPVPVPKGHYEKRVKDVSQYIFVNGEKPSGMPNSFVVPEEEAKGTQA